MIQFPDINQWIDPSKSRSRQSVSKFFNQHLDKNGDIHFLYNLWKHIEKNMTTNNLFNNIDINQLKTTFINYKAKYLTKQKIPFDQFLVLDQMFNSGKLNTEDEFYYYVDNVNLDFTTDIKSSR